MPVTASDLLIWQRAGITGPPGTPGSQGSPGSPGSPGTPGANGVAVAGVSSLTANYTAITSDASKLFLCSGGAFTITLPSAVTAGNGWSIFVRNLYANSTAQGTVSVATVSSQTINAAASPLSILPGQECLVVSDGANWQTFGLPHKVLLVADDVLSSTPSRTYALPVGYRSFELLFTGVLFTAESNLAMLVSVDGGATYRTANYERGVMYDSTSTAVAYSAPTTETVGYLSPAIGTSANAVGISEVDFWPGNANRRPTWRLASGGFGTASAWSHSYIQYGFCNDVNGPVNYIQIKPASGSISEMHATIFGLA